MFSRSSRRRVAALVGTHPLPQATRDRWLSRDGTWQVELGAEEPLPIEVPFTFEEPLSGIGAAADVHERVVYRRRFSVPDEWRGSRILLRFGAVDWRATVYVDGAAVGSHAGGYTHFTLDLGGLEGEHELVVEVEDPA